MINGCCFLVSNVSHYNPIQHHLSCAWSISSMPLSITMQHIFSICSANCTTSDFLYFHHERNRLHNTHNLRTICDHDAFINFISINLLNKMFFDRNALCVQLMRCKYWRLSFYFFLFWFRSAYCDKVDELRIKFLHNILYNKMLL